MAEAFAETGARVWVADVDTVALASCPEDWWRSEVNVADEASVQAWFAEVEQQWGGLDTLCANAGVAGPTALVEDVALEDWRACMGVNLEGAFLCAKYAAPILKGQGSGSILITSSTAGNMAIPTGRLMLQPNGVSSAWARPWRWSLVRTASGVTSSVRVPSRARVWRACWNERLPPRA